MTEISKNQLRKLGRKISDTEGDIPESDLQVLQEYRKSFKDPLAEVFTKVNQHSKKLNCNCIVTYRIKRINTIVRKLKRFKSDGHGHMELDRIGDIAGCRCILLNDEDNNIYSLVESLKEDFPENQSNDYLKETKNDGYKSFHLYVDTESETYPKRKVEIQIRNIKHHNWATLVEIIDLLYAQKIKEGMGSEELKEFLRLFSDKDNLSDLEKFKLIKLGEKNKIFENICNVFANNYLNVRKNWATQKKTGNYYVIEAGKGMQTTIDKFKDFEEAEKSYYEKYLGDRESNIVLTYIKNAKFEDISIAYSNYLLVVHTFFEDYISLLEECTISSIKNNNNIQLWRTLSEYRTVMVLYLTSFMEELNTLFMNRIEISHKHKLEWISDLKNTIDKFSNKMYNHHTNLHNLKMSRFAKFAVNIQFKMMEQKIEKIKYLY